jgi:ribonucleoside-diphosphate reductase beta chain
MDEATHCEFACLLYSKLQHTRLPQADIHEMFAEAISIEKEFVNDALPVSLLGMNAADMCQYIEFVANFWLNALGYDKLSEATNPFPFMDMINLQGKTNFFERRVGEYQKAGVMADREKQTFSLDEDF